MLFFGPAGRGTFKRAFSGARRTGVPTVLAAGVLGAAMLTPSGPAAAQVRVDNPYEGATVYVNPEWSANAAAAPGGDAIADQPTAVWLERISWIEDPGGEAGRTMGLADHLDQALVQDADLVQLVLHNLPGRSCARPSWQGELGPGEIDRYKNEYIDPITDILGRPRYAGLRIVVLVEPDSLSNLIVNTSPQVGATALCEEMLANGNYVEGLGYALAELSKVPNVYSYLDAGHHGLLGWPDMFWPWVDLVTETVHAGASPGDVHGFVVNVADYGAVHEPYFTREDFVHGVPAYQSNWVDWNFYIDEHSYTEAVRVAATYMGFDPHISMVIDTSRNGWGGPDRPTGPGPQTTVDEYVDGSRIDRRISASFWCNQVGAGLGERPVPNPEPGIDAYVWIKPPGESDGSGDQIVNDEGRDAGAWCGNNHWREGYTGALPDAPLFGRWFPEHFRQLLANAYPPVGAG